MTIWKSHVDTDMFIANSFQQLVVFSFLCYAIIYLLFRMNGFVFVANQTGTLHFVHAIYIFIELLSECFVAS